MDVKQSLASVLCCLSCRGSGWQCGWSLLRVVWFGISFFFFLWGQKVEWRRSEEGLVIKCFKSSVSLLKSNYLSSRLNSIAFQVKTDDPKSCMVTWLKEEFKASFMCEIWIWCCFRMLPILSSLVWAAWSEVCFWSASRLYNFLLKNSFTFWFLNIHLRCSTDRKCKYMWKGRSRKYDVNVGH